FEKDKSSFRDLTKTFLQNSNSISSFLSSELTTIKMFQESKRIRVAYHDIVKTLANVSDNFEDRIQYAVISGCFGVFLGFIAGMGVGSYMVSFDGGVVFLSTVLHVWTFKSGVQTFEKFWTGHVDFLTNVQQIIENSFKVNIDLKPINTQSIF
ncbi:22040_t:CDS:2, partial [Gigaspora rosea]